MKYQVRRNYCQDLGIKPLRFGKKRRKMVIPAMKKKVLFRMKERFLLT